MSRRTLIIAVSVALVLLIVAGCGAWVLRRSMQIKKLQNAAELAEKAGDWNAAETYLRRCLSLRGDNAQLCGRIGRVIEQGAISDEDRGRAIPFYAKSLRVDPENLTVRLRLAELQLISQPQDALKHVAVVLAEDAGNRDAERVRALALARLLPQYDVQESQLREAWDHLRTAQRDFPGDIHLATVMAEIGRRFSTQLAIAETTSRARIEAEADSVMDQLVAASDDEAEARMRRLLYRRQFVATAADANSLREDLDPLLELRPSSNVLRLLAAGLETRQAFPAAPWESQQTPANLAAVDRARQHLVAATEHEQADPAAFLSLAQLQWWCGERETATKTLTDGLEAGDPANPILNLRLAETALALGQWDLAASALKSLETRLGEEPAEGTLTELQKVVDMLWTQWWLGVDNPERDPAKALERLERYDHQHLPEGLRTLAVYLRGLCHASLAQWSQAEDDFTQAARATNATVLPQVAAACMLARQGRYADAVTRYRQALLAQQQTGESINVRQAWIELARCALAEQDGQSRWKQQWRVFDEALATLQRQLPDSPIPWYLELTAVSIGRRPAKGRSEAELLARGAREFATQPEYWRMLAGYHLRRRDPAAALQAAEQYESLSGGEDAAQRLDIAVAQRDPTETDRLLQTLAAAAPAYQQAGYVVQRAQMMARDGRLDEAEALLAEWLKLHPADRQVHFQRAQLAWQRGDVTTLEKLGRTLPKSGDKSGDTADAAGAICKVQALFLRHVGNGDAAVANQLLTACTEAAREFPNDRAVRVLEGIVTEHLGEPRRAIRAFQAARDCGERDPSVLLRIASLLLEARQAGEALEYCLLAADRIEDCRAAALATQILVQGNVDQAGARRAEQLFGDTLAGDQRPGFDLFLINLANLREHQDKADEAIELTRRALDRQPDSVALQNNLAWFLAVYAGDPAAARPLIDQAIETAGELPPLLDTKGVVLLAQDQADAAIEVLEKSVEGSTVPSARYLHLAEAYQRAGRESDAVRMLRQAEDGSLLELSPRDRKALVSLKVALP